MVAAKDTALVATAMVAEVAYSVSAVIEPAVSGAAMLLACWHSPGVSPSTA